MKTPRQVIAVLKECTIAADKHERDCLIRAIAIVRLWDAGITPADVRKAERERHRTTPGYVTLATVTALTKAERKRKGSRG